MAARVHKSAAARRDLRQHAIHLGEHSVQAARQFLAACERAFVQLAEGPTLGSLSELAHPDFGELRFWTLHRFRNHVIYYRPAPDGIEIIRVLHGAQDAETIFGT